MTRSSRDSGQVRLSDGVVVALILSLLAGFALVFVGRSRELSNETRCTNQLSQLGSAFHQYHDDWKCLPTESWNNPRFMERPPDTHGHTSFYCYLLPYVNEQAQLAALMGDATTAGNLASAKPVALFLCPARHAIKVPASPALRDFGYRQSW